MIASDRVFQIIVVIAVIILAVDLINVLFVGGPSVSTLVFKPGTPVAASEISSQAPVYNAQVTQPGTASAASRGAGENISSVQKVASTTGAIPAIYVPTKATPVPVVEYVVEVTPMPTARSESTLRYVPPVTQAPPQDEYVTIYSKNLTYPDQPTALAFTVKEPPLIIRFTVSPVIITDFKVVTNRSGTKAYPEAAFNLTRASENSWFTVTVYDRETGEIFDEDGFGETFNQHLDHTLVVHEAGCYLVQFDGANANVQVDMLLKRAGNVA